MSAMPSFRFFFHQELATRNQNRLSLVNELNQSCQEEYAQFLADGRTPKEAKQLAKESARKAIEEN